MIKNNYTQSRRYKHARNETDEKGFIMVLLLLLALSILAVKMAKMYMEETQVSINVRVSDVPTKMHKIQDAINAFAVANQRLPCPAKAFTNTTGTTYTLANYNEDVNGREASGSMPCSMFSGTVPWGTLGLAPEDVVDGWGNRISYHVYAEQDVGTGDILLDPTKKKSGDGDQGGLIQAFQYICDNINEEGSNECHFFTGFHICAEDDIDGNDACDSVKQDGVAYALISHGEMNYNAISSSGGARITHNNANKPKTRNSILKKLQNPYDPSAPTNTATEIYDIQYDAGSYPTENPSSDSRYDDIVLYSTFEELFSVTRTNELVVPDYCAGEHDPDPANQGIIPAYDYANNDANPDGGSADLPNKACINELLVCYQLHQALANPIGPTSDDWDTLNNCIDPDDPSSACHGAQQVFWPDHTPREERKNWLAHCPWDISSRTGPDFY